MQRTIKLSGKLPSLNTLINYAKRHWGAYAGIKKQWKKKVNDCINPNWNAFMKPVHIDIILYFTDKRKRDLDNYAPKLLFDGLTKKDNPDKFLIYDDSSNWIKSYRVMMQFQADKEQIVMIINDQS